MPTPRGSFRMLAFGIALGSIGIKISNFDLSPNVVSYALIVLGLLGVMRLHRAFRVAMLATLALGLLDLYTFLNPPPPLLPLRSVIGLELNNDPFRVVWSWQALIVLPLNFLFNVAIITGMFAFFAERGHKRDAENALGSRNDWVLIALAFAIFAGFTFALPSLGIVLMIFILVYAILSIRLALLVWRAAAVPVPSVLLQHLIAPATVKWRSIPDVWLPRTPAARHVVAAALGGYAVLLWSIATPCSTLDRMVRKSGCVALLESHPAPATGATVGAGERTVVSNSGGVVRETEIATGRLVRQLSDEDAYDIYGVAVAPDGVTVAAVQRSGIRIWRAGVLHATLGVRADERWSGAPTFSRDGALLAAIDDAGRVRVWRVVDGRALYVLYDLVSRASALRFTPDGTLVAASDRDIAEWHISDGTLLQKNALPSDIQAPTFDANGFNVIVAQGDAINMYAVRTGALVGQLGRAGIYTESKMVLSHDGSLLAIWGGRQANRIEVRRTSDAVAIATFPVDEGYGTYGWETVEFSPNDTMLVTTGINEGRGRNNVAVWHIQ